MSAIYKSIITTVSKMYKQSLAKRLAPYGLKYQDLLIETPEVTQALARLDPQLLREREMRIKRSFDISLKKKPLPLEHQEADPFDHYLDPVLKPSKSEKEERDILNSY